MTNPTKPLEIGSLFSGAGLCDLGFHRAGFGHRFFCEVDPYCRSVLARHWPGVPIYPDIRRLCPDELPDVDVLVGGFPCQDVSCSGNRAGITEKTRSGLWYEYKRIIETKQPKYAVIENVKGLLSKGMETVLQDLSSIGYDAEWQCVPASAFGAPHLRERIFIVAYPHSHANDQHGRIFASDSTNLENLYQLGSVSDWLGIRIDRARKQTIRQAYRGPVLCRVGNGSAERLDDVQGRKPGQLNIPNITQETYKKWLPMLKALSNGILPQQAHFVACCILRAEGLPLPV